eukprot:gb/GECG01009844.1/.p1 GENE.gb/GECG01009844.1/~~gb/GECG01009844.1/.p1  ORF type:complete len:590 (+),score=95.04 gb/GECG01009844.1/:1-1770(+)
MTEEAEDSLRNGESKEQPERPASSSRKEEKQWSKPPPLSARHQRAQTARRQGQVAQTRAFNYNGPSRRPVSATAPRRVKWEANPDEELKFEAHLVATQQAAAPTPRDRTPTLRRFRCRDLLSSHAQRVERAEDLGRADYTEAQIAKEVVRWQVRERESRNKERRRKLEKESVNSARPTSGFSTHRPETADEWVINNLWQRRREEELVQYRNNLQVNQALNEWQTHKNRLEEEIQRRIETRRRPFTEQTDKTFKYGTTIRDMFTPVEKSEAKYDDFEALSIESFSDEENEEADQKQEHDEGEEMEQEGKEQSPERPSSRRPYTPQARGDAAALDISTARPGTTDTEGRISRRRRSKQSSARHKSSRGRNRLQSPVIIPRKGGVTDRSAREDTDRSERHRPQSTLRMLGSRAESRDTRPSTEGLANRKTWYTADDEVPAPRYENPTWQNKLTEWSEATQEQSIEEAEASYRLLRKANIKGVDPQVLRRALVLDTVDVPEDEEEKKKDEGTIPEASEETNDENKQESSTGKAGGKGEGTERQSERPTTAPAYMTTFGLGCPGSFLPRNPFLEEKKALYDPPKSNKGKKGKKK